MKIGISVKNINFYYSHVNPTVQYGVKRGISYVVYYLGKFYPHTYELKNTPYLEFKDVSYVYNLKVMFLKDKLDYVLLHDPGNLFECVIISLLKGTNIKSVYHQHGLVTSEKYPLKVDNSKIINSVLKYIYFIKLMTYNIFRADNSRQVLKYYLKRLYYIFRFDTNPLVRRLGIDTILFDYGFVYSNEDKYILLKHMGMEPNNVFVTGLPFVEDDNSFQRTVNGNKRVLFLSTGLFVGGVVLQEDELKIFKTIYNLNKISSLEIIVKLHPKEDEATIKKKYPEKSNFKIYGKVNLTSLVKSADVVIGDFSIALTYAIKYYKPLIILNYDFYPNFPFDFSNYGVGIKISLNELGNYLDRIKDKELQVDREKYDNMMREVFGCQKEEPRSIFFKELEKIAPHKPTE